MHLLKQVHAPVEVVHHSLPLPESRKNAHLISIKVVTADQRTFMINCRKDETVDALKNAIHTATDIP